MAWPMSDACAAALVGNHTTAFKFDILRAGAVQVTLTGRATGGSVVDDKNADRRRRLEGLTIVNPMSLNANDTGPLDLIPRTGTDLISTYGNEIRPYHGINLADGSTEWVPAGTFRITKLTMKEGSQGLTMTVSGDDRSINVSRNAWLSVFPVTDDTGANVSVLKSHIIRKVIMDRYPQASFAQSPAAWEAKSPAMTPTAPQLFANRCSDPWAFIKQLTQAIGCELWCDRMGNFMFDVDPVLAAGANPANFTLVEGADCTFDDISRDIDDATDGCNVFVVTGVGSGVTSSFPPTGLYWDNDPSSPTFVAPWSEGNPTLFTANVTMWNVLNGTAILQAPNGSTYGLVVKSFTDPVVTSPTEAIASAKKHLALNLGPTETVTLQGWSIPHIEVDDVVAVVRNKAGVTGGNYVVTSVRTPFAPGDRQTITAKKQRVFSA